MANELEKVQRKFDDFWEDRNSVSISAFLSNMSYGARANLFRVRIFDLAILSSMSTFEFYCKAANIPARSIASVPVKYKNNTLYLPGDSDEFSPWTATIINDENMTVRGNLELWMDSYKLPGETISLRGMSSLLFYGSADVELLDSNGYAIAIYKFMNMLPVELGEISLSWDSSDTIQEYSVTFNYTSYLRAR